MRAEPYSLAIGAAVSIQVIAHNAYGDSLVSATGSGALIQAVPAAPTTLTNNAV